MYLFHTLYFLSLMSAKITYNQGFHIVYVLLRVLIQGIKKMNFGYIFIKKYKSMFKIIMFKNNV